MIKNDKQNNKFDTIALAAIEKLHKKDRVAAMQGDVDTLVSLFTDDGIVIPADGDIVRGKEALRNMLEQDRELHKEYTIIEYEHDFKEITICGSYAYEWGFYHGKYRSKNDGHEITGSGKLMRILRQQTDGSWKVARAIWTVDNS